MRYRCNVKTHGIMLKHVCVLIATEGGSRMKFREFQHYLVESVVICHCKEYPLDHGDCPVCMEEEE